MESSGHVFDLNFTAHFMHYSRCNSVFAALLFKVQIFLFKVTVKLRPRQSLRLKSGFWCYFGFASSTGASILVLSIGLADPFDGP